jgi:hypothetical protein
MRLIKTNIMKKLLFFACFTAVSQLGIAQVTFSNQSLNTNHRDRGIVDMNGDNLDDVISIATNNVQIFYQQQNGSFIEANIGTTNADNSPSWSLAAADYDRNGHTDLLYGGGNGVTFMRANNTGTGFTEISGSEYVFSQRSNFVDINNDGHLDAFVCHDVEPNVYYINDGNGNFQYNQGGLGDYPSGGNYGSVWIDFDNDRDMDLFIAKCGGESARRDNEMHRNNGDGTFTEIASTLNLEDDMQTWSSAWADYDNDGDMDAWIGASTLDDGFHRLMRNNGNGTFTDVIGGSGLESFNNTDIENQTYDIDNDGNTDIISGGRILYGNGDLTFNISGTSIGNGGFGDLNNDGFIDAMGNNSIRINNGNNNNWLKITTAGTQSNVNGIGARVEVTTESGTRIRDVRSGEGFGNMSSLNTHVGLGTDTEIDNVTIFWPSGIIDVYDDVEINTSRKLVEGQGVLGIEDFLTDDITLYPNPSIDAITITNIEDVNDPIYSVFDITGRQVLHGRLINNTLDVSQLTSGQYILRVTDGGRFRRNNVKAKKFTKR